MNGNYSNETIVVVAEDLPVFRLIPFQRFNRAMCCILGIPLNILVVVVILRSRQLWSARNIFWLAVTFFNLLALTQAVTELSIFYLYRRENGSHQTLCEIYSTLLGYPYALLLTGLTLASLDRYLALSRNNFYQHYATPRNTTLILIIIFIIVTVGQTSPYWLGILPIKCDLNVGWISVLVFFQGVLSLSCLVVQVKLYSFVRSCIRYDLPVKSDTSTGLITYPISGISITLNKVQNLSRPQQERCLNRLELRAARILGTGVLPFCFVTLTLCVSSVTLVVFRLRGLEGFWLQVVMVASRELILTHLVYTPAVFVVQSREFRAAFKRFCRCRRQNKMGDQFC